MGKALKVHLFIVDPQNDFMGNDDGTSYSIALADGNTLAATLPVKGGVSDMKRAAKLIDRTGHKLDDVHVTLDSHRKIDVAHAGMWRDENGRPPAPFTLIRHDDIRNGIWQPRNPGLRKRMLVYTESLEKQGKYLLIIWPDHCLIGSWGHNVQVDLAFALNGWEAKNFANVDYVTKGTNPYTEHYGGLMAEVPDPNDPSTQLNTQLIQVLQDADLVYFLGEASSHCVKATVEQVAENIGDEHLKKLHLVTDCMSPVPAAPGTPDFPAIAQTFLNDMKSRGMTLVTSDEVLR